LPLWSILLHGGAIASVYFLVAMISALLHRDPEARARLQAAGLAAALLLMMAGAMLRPSPPGAEPAGSPLPGAEPAGSPLPPSPHLPYLPHPGRLPRAAVEEGVGWVFPAGRRDQLMQEPGPPTCNSSAG